jgi:hypothetical protein
MLTRRAGRKLFDGKGRGVTVVAAAVAVSVLFGAVPRGGPAAGAAISADGPLVVSSENPRFFTAGSGEAVYLVGSNLWNNLQDGAGLGSCDQPGPSFDWTAYLDFLESHHMNFIRGWRWEHFKFELPPDLDTGGPYCVAPHPWQRNGPGVGYDGKPKFDLATFDETYFDRLRARIIEAGDRGIYVSVMLFEGFCLHECDEETMVAGHPFDGQNNVNDVDIDSIEDYQSANVAGPVVALQRAYLRKVIDTVHDLDNVLYEVANESWTGSVPWQYDVIDYVKQYESEMDYQTHPVGMSAIWPQGSDDWLFESPADWIMPGTYPPVADYRNDPPAATGAKVIISDDDHYAPCDVDALWAWKSFTRGLYSSQLDCAIGDPTQPNPDFDFLESARLAQGDVRRLTDEIDLWATEPRGDLTSTGYALANPGVEYIILQPEPDARFTATVAAGTYRLSWFNVETRTWTGAAEITAVGEQVVDFTPPFASPGPVVLHLRAV